MKKKPLFILTMMLSSLALASCGEQSSLSNTSKPTTESTPEKDHRSFEEMYENLKKPMTVTGAAIEKIGKNGTTSTSLNNSISVILGDKSFHIEQTGDSESIISSVYTDDTHEKALHYFINAQNEVEYETITDSDGNEVAWKEYANPFLYVDSSLFSIEEDGYYEVDLADDSIKDDYNFLVNNLTYINFKALGKQYGETFEYIRLLVEDDAITGMEILSKKFTDTLGTTQFQWNLTFDYDQSKSHEYPLPSKLETKPYHEKLKTALNVLTTGETTYAVNATEDFGGGSTFHYKTILTKDVVYISDVDYGDVYAYVQKDDGVHDVEVKSDGTYAYKEELSKDKSGNDVTDIKTLFPKIALAVEWFKYDDTTKEYTLSSSSAGAFGYSIATFAMLDPQIAASTSLTLKLTDDETKVASMTFGETPITMEFDYSDTVKLPFDPATLEVSSIFATFKGTYKATIDNVEVTIVVTDDSVTWNGEACTNVQANKYGEISFDYNGSNYSINNRKTKLYNNPSSATYTLTQKA